MSSLVFFEVFHFEQQLGKGTCTTPFVVGRQGSEADPAPVAVKAGPQTKLIIAPLESRGVPRSSLAIDVEPTSGKLLALNLHSQLNLFLASGATLAPGAQMILGHDGAILFPDEYRVQFSLAPLSDSPPVPRERDSSQSFLFLDRQADVTDQFPAVGLLSMMDQQSPAHQPIGPQGIAVRLVKSALEAFKQPAGSPEFFEAACRAAIQMIEVDRVLVLQKVAGEWSCRARAVRPDMSRTKFDSVRFSRSLLAEMEAAGKTTVVEPQLSQQELVVSMAMVDRAVASPILDDKQQVIGALYGDREVGGIGIDQPIGELEAALLEVLASGISSSLAVEREQELRSSMAQFFSPVVLSQLKNDPTLLAGREAEISVLFCDVRGFSTVTERIGPTKSIDWINDVLTVLSECVHAHDGVLVDYVGDELMAMWGAPGSQPDHAIRACQAAMDMLRQSNPLRKKWRDLIPEGFGFGIGINSGTASVGNTGSQQRFKYGPLGNTVNLASRVQGITKMIRVPGLITGQTARAAAAANLQTRRLAHVRVVGIKQPVELFEVTVPDSDFSDLCQRFESALTAYERKDLRSAAGQLASLLQDYPDDGPTIILLNRAVELLTQPEREFDPVWNLTQK